MTPKLHRQFLDIAGEFSPELKQHMRRLGPVQIPNRKYLGLPQFLARIIIGQQLSTKAAHTIWSRIKAAARDAEERIPQFFREDNFEELRACGASANKARALLAINEAFADGRLTASKLRRMDFDERSALLLDLRGVGQWTVDMASMFYFGDTDIWPQGDLAVGRTFRGYLDARRARDMDRLVARFAPNRSYLAFYMWQIVDGVP
ncbi:MAG TPA: DNA-3-methyladenine glycosylase 2 family protein [Gammaproteobacteria bacterium]|jgi:DNA-3-methyladenine glycosylase II|nr:DNA-3-methyladenine glycosylase 2 family protein [Gammaproteobacteria bacterium]